MNKQRRTLLCNLKHFYLNLYRVKLSLTLRPGFESLNSSYVNDESLSGPCEKRAIYIDIEKMCFNYKL